jgi:hypothetical protein
MNLDDNNGLIYFTGKNKDTDVAKIIGGKISVNAYGDDAFNWLTEIDYPWDITSYVTSNMMLFGEWIIDQSSFAYFRLLKGIPFYDPSKVLKYTPSTSLFIPILTTGYNSTIEINKNTPIEAFHKAPDGASYSAFIYQNPTSSEDGWVEIKPRVPIHDLRTCEVINSETFTIEEGTIGDESKWCIYGTTNQLRAFPTSVTGEPVFLSDDNTILIQSFDFNVTNVETTNYNGNPYIFLSVSGIKPDEGIEIYEGFFFQRGQNDVEFMDLSYGLPLSKITIIRVDDRI